jgi:hypothetical protein
LSVRYFPNPPEGIDQNAPDAVGWRREVAHELNIDEHIAKTAPVAADEILIFSVADNNTRKTTLAECLPAITQGTQPFVAVFMLNGAPSATQRLLHFKAPFTITFAAGLAPSAGNARTLATAQTDFDIQRNAVSVGTVRWTAAVAAASFIAASQIVLAANDILEVFAPGTPDATLADFGVSLSGLR